MTTDRPLVLLRPAPQQLDRIFDDSDLKRLRAEFRVVELGTTPADEQLLDDLLPEAIVVVGQPDLPRERLIRAGRLRAIVNVEGNFFPNVDYPTAFALGVRVLGCGPAYADAVAEMALGLAIDLARGISREDRAFRVGTERYVGNTADSILLRRAHVGLVGFGNLGHALLPLLRAFDPTIRVHDPWLPARVLQESGLHPASLDDVFAHSQFVFVLAAVTDTNSHLIGDVQLNLLRPGARLVLVSRAAVVDFEALVDHVARGRFLAAVDVWPEEPVSPDHPARAVDGFVLSPHRAGGIPAAFRKIGEMTCDDLELIAAGLPPVRLQQASPELVGRYRNNPVG